MQENLELKKEIYLKDLSLKDIYDGKVSGPLQSEVFLAKPWVANYVKSPVFEFDFSKNLYENYCMACQSRLDEAILFFEDQGVFTNRQLIDMVEKMASAIQKIGMARGSKIGVLVNNSVEEPVSLLASIAAGTCIKLIDFTKSINDIKNDVEKSNFDLLIMDEIFLPMEPIINSNGTMVVVANAKEKHENYTSFDDFLELGNDKQYKTYPSNLDDVSVIINSSGTTGKPKPIGHSNFSIQMAIQKMLHTDYPLNDKNIMMKIIPAHIGLGLITTLSTCLITGTKLVFIKGNNPAESIQSTVGFVKNYKNFVKKNKFSMDSKLLMFAAPMFYRVLYGAMKDIDDLSFIGCMLAAGSKMSKEELDMMSEGYKMKGCMVPICNGYGQNEHAGAVALNTINHYKNGSAGFPVIGTDVRIVNMEDKQILGVNQIGEIVERSTSQFNSYVGMEDVTKKSKIVLDDIEWFDTKDLGYMDEEGFLFITGRASRVITRYDTKIHVDGIENKVRNHVAVHDCAVVSIKHDSIDDDIPAMFIELNDEYKNYYNTANDLINEIQMGPDCLSELEMPVYVDFAKIPYLSSGKVDYVSLDKLAISIHNDNNKKKALVK